MGSSYYNSLLSSLTEKKSRSRQTKMYVTNCPTHPQCESIIRTVPVAVQCQISKSVDMEAVGSRLQTINSPINQTLSLWELKETHHTLDASDTGHHGHCWTQVWNRMEATFWVIYRVLVSTFKLFYKWGGFAMRNKMSVESKLSFFLFLGQNRDGLADHI